MNREAYLELHENVCNAARDLSDRKGHDYSGEEDTLRNLKACELLGLCSAEEGVLVRMQDKMSRLATLVPGATEPLVPEPVGDTILDLLNC